MHFAGKEFGKDESEALSALTKLLALSREAKVFDVADRLKEMSTSANMFMQVAAARNVLLIRNLEEKTLELMDYFSDPVRHKYVRRPISNERCLMFLIEQTQSRVFKARAEALVNKLLRDPDQIIRITAFDLAESLKEEDSEFLKQLCDDIEKGEPYQATVSQDLISRASRIRAGLA